MNRRQFIGRAAATLGASLISSSFSDAGTASLNDQIHLGIIGPGSRGQQLMRTIMRVPGVRFTGLCDIYEPRFAAARKITGEQTPVYHSHEELLAAKDIDAVIRFPCIPSTSSRRLKVAAMSTARRAWR